MRKLYTGSVEYLKVRVRSLTGEVQLDEQTVEFSFDQEDWHTAEWTGDAGTTRVAQLLVGASVEIPDPGYTNVYVRVGGSPESPVVNAGRLAISR